MLLLCTLSARSLSARSLSGPAARKPAGISVPGIVRRFAAWCVRCHARAAQRRHLAELDERMLRDVGITPSQAAEECAKPWWRP